MQALTSAPAQLHLVQLKSADEAFRIATMLMAADKDYRKLQLHVTHLVLSAIQRNHYRLLVVGNQAVGCVLWAEISTATLDHCLQQQREPGPDQLLAN